MGLEYRNGNPYYYRKIRKGNKVVSEYVASGEMALIAAELQNDENYSKKNNQKLKCKEQDIHRQEDAELRYLEKTLNEFFTSVALTNGYHKPKRQWRKKRKN